MSKQQEALYLCGIKPILELLEKSPFKIDSVTLRKGRPCRESDAIITLCKEAGIRFTLVPEEALVRMVGDEIQHQGVVARLLESPRMEYSDLLIHAFSAPLPLIIALDQVQDPGNVGTLARTLYALGGAGLVLPLHNSAFLGPGARRSAAGALEHLPVSQVVNLSRAVQEAQDAGLHTYAAQKAPNSLNPLIATLKLPALLVLGSEDKGLRPGVASRCQESLDIPFRREFDSLNVAQAGAILVAAFSRV